MKTLSLWLFCLCGFVFWCSEVSAQPIRYEVRLLPEIANSDPGTTTTRGLNDNRIIALSTSFFDEQRAYFSNGQSLFRIPGIAPGFERNTATCVNELDEIAGSAFIEDQQGQGGYPPALPYVYSNGVVTPLAIPAGETGGVPYALNNRGLAVGSSFWTNLPVVWDRNNNSAAVITSPTMQTGVFYSVNDTGTTVGAWSDSTSALHACIYDENGLRDLPGLGGQIGAAYSINSSGKIGGSFADASGIMRGVVWENEIPTLIPGIPNAIWTGIETVTDSGLMLGQSIMDPESGLSFLRIDGQNYLFDDLVSSAPAGYQGVHGIRDINNRGDAVGYVRVDGQLRTALLVVVPGPSAISLGGIVWLCWPMRRRRNTD